MTSTLQQEGGRKLRLSASQVMRVAQGLYERGYITYMRTDNVTLSDEALSAVRAEVKRGYGDKFLSPAPRQFSSKIKNAQEAHEAIRPSTPLRSPDSLAGRAERPRAVDVPHDLAAHAGVADGRRHRHHRDRAARRDRCRPDPRRRRHRRSVRGQRHHDQLRRLPPGVRRVGRRQRGRRRRPRGIAAAAHRRGRGARRVADTQRPHHVAAGALHRGLARQAARGARHRPAVDVGVDHPDRAGPRLRVEEGPGPGAHVDGVRRRRLDGEALRRAGRLRLHRPDRGRPRLDRPQRAPEAGLAAALLLRRRRRQPSRSEATGRGEPRRDRRRRDQHLPDRQRPRRQRRSSSSPASTGRT